MTTRTSAATAAALASARASALTATVTWCTDPFLGKINPGTHEGIKLYTTATKERSKENRLSASQDNVDAIMEAFRGDCNNFGWGPLVNCVLLANGTSKSILNDFQAVTLNDVKLLSVSTWGNKTATRATVAFPVLLTVETLDPEFDLGDQKVFIIDQDLKC